jgi:tetratricopeptide (TPR) repeat protein
MPRAAVAAAPLRRKSGILGALALTLPLVVGLEVAGLVASRAYLAAWPVWYGSDNLSAESPGLALNRLERMMRRWPAAESSGMAGHLARSVSEREGVLPDERGEWLGQAERLYAEASRLNPYDPEWPVNRANVLSYLGRDDEAEEEFARAILLQGGNEGSFRARYYLAAHLYRRWYKAWTRERRAGEALGGFLRARDLLDEAEALTEPWVQGMEGRELRDGLEKTISFLEGAKVLPEPASRD